MNNNAVERIRKALLKRALGYNSTETVVEYSGDGEECTVVRKKVTEKDVPPDISAAKLLLEKWQTDDYSTMTDEQLEAEKRRLLSLLKGECVEKNKNFGETEGFGQAEKAGETENEKEAESADENVGSFGSVSENDGSAGAADFCSVGIRTDFRSAVRTDDDGLIGSDGADDELAESVARTGKGKGGTKKKCKN